MQSQLPSQIHVWGVLPPKFHSDLTLHTGEREEHEIIDELTGVLVQAVALEAAGRQAANSTGRKVGRPREVMIPYLAPESLIRF